MLIFLYIPCYNESLESVLALDIPGKIIGLDKCSDFIKPEILSYNALWSESVAIKFTFPVKCFEIKIQSILDLMFEFTDLRQEYTLYGIAYRFGNLIFLAGELKSPAHIMLAFL